MEGAIIRCLTVTKFLAPLRREFGPYHWLRQAVILLLVGGLLFATTQKMSAAVPEAHSSTFITNICEGIFVDLAKSVPHLKYEIACDVEGVEVFYSAPYVGSMPRLPFVNPSTHIVPIWE